MELFKKLFHHCSDHLEYIEGTRYPETGTTGRGKVWRNYRCTVCGKNSIHRVEMIYTP